MDIVSDTFTDTSATALASHVGEFGGTWTKHASYASGGLVISDANRCRASAAAHGVYYTSARMPTADYSVQASFYFVTDVGNWSGVVARCATGAATYYALIYLPGTHSWDLYKFVAGAGTQLGTWSQAYPGDGVAVTARLECIGTAIKAYIAGVERISVTDSDISAAGRAGVAIDGGSGNNANNAGLHLDTLSVTAVGDTAAVNDASLFLSPYNWRVSGSTFAQTTSQGAYLKTKFTGTRVGILWDTTPLSSGSVPEASYPIVRYSVDGGAYTTAAVADGAALLASGLADTTHTLELHVIATDFDYDRWTTPANVIKFRGLFLDVGDALAAPDLRPNRLLIYGDSTSCGDNAAAATDWDDADGSAAWGHAVAQALDAEVGIVAYGAQGLTVAGDANVPALATAYELHSAGQTRLVSSLLSPAPNYIVVVHGTNDHQDAVTDGTFATAVATLLTNLRAKAPLAWLLLGVPFGGFKRAAISTGVAAYRAAAPSDARTAIIDLGTAIQEGLELDGGATRTSFDGVHPDIPTHGRIGAAMAAAITEATGTVVLADGSITSAKFTVSAPSGVASGILEKIDQLWRRFFKRSVYDGTNLKTYGDDGTTVLTTQALTKSGTTQTQGPAA